MRSDYKVAWTKKINQQTNKQTTPQKLKLAQMCTICILWLLVFIGKEEKGRNCLGHFRVTQWRNQGVMMPKRKFGLNIKQNMPVVSSVQLSDVPKADAVEIWYIRFCNVRQTVLCIFCLKNLFSEF